MAEPEALTLTYISAHPAEAARVLERIPGADAAALFATVPARAAAPVLTAMLPSAAARILGSLDDAPALALLAASGVQAAVTMLRYIPEPRRSRLLGGLPTATAVPRAYSSVTRTTRSARGPTRTSSHLHPKPG